MSLGTYGSTLLSELNRLANGGTYPPVNLYDEAGAARVWAQLLDIATVSTDTVGVLNEIAGLPRDQWLDYSGVCNYIAGTTRLPAAAALRQVEGAASTPQPGPPSGAMAVAGNQSATVTFLSPEYQGDSEVFNYRATVSPGGATFFAPGSPIPISGLTNGTQYTFTIAAENSSGFGPESAPSNVITPNFVPYQATPVTNYVYTTGPNTWSQIYAFQNAGCVGAAFGGGYTYASCPVTTWTCPEGGIYDQTTGMCVESYPAVQENYYSFYVYTDNGNTGLVCITPFGEYTKFQTFTGSYTFSTIAVRAYGNTYYNQPTNDFITTTPVTSYTCPTGTLNPATNMCE